VTEALSAFYGKCAASKKFKVVLNSADETASDYEEYFSQTALGLAIPYGDPMGKALAVKYAVRCIPTILVFNKEGKLVTDAGRTELDHDPAGEHFPWHPKLVPELFREVELVDKHGKKEVLASLAERVETIAFYFTSFTYPPAKEFTERLVTWYNAHCSPGKELHGKLEVVHCLNGDSQEVLDRALQMVPWPAIPMAQRRLKAALGTHFNYVSAPKLVIVNAKTCKIITGYGCHKIEKEPEGYPFHDKPVEALSEATVYLDDIPVCIVFAEHCSSAVNLESARKALEEVAREHWKDGKASGKLRFALATGDDESVAGLVRRVMQGERYTDADGPEAIRVAIVDFNWRKKVLFSGFEAGLPYADDLRAFVRDYLDGKATEVDIKASHTD
jgi:Thioredoxin-like